MRAVALSQITAYVVIRAKTGIAWTRTGRAGQLRTTVLIYRIEYNSYNEN